MRTILQLLLSLIVLVPSSGEGLSPRRIRELAILEFSDRQVSLSEQHKARLGQVLEGLTECGRDGYRQGTYTIISGSLPRDGVARDYQTLGQRADSVLSYLTERGIHENRIFIEVRPRAPHRLDPGIYPREVHYIQFVHVQAICMVQGRAF